MHRREFLKRIAVGAIAIQTVDLDTFQAAMTEVNPYTEIVRSGAVVSSGTFDEIMRNYYLPPIREMLNSDSIFIGKTLRVPLHFRDGGSTYGEAKIYLDRTA